MYPLLNIILIIPAIPMFIGFKKEPELSVPRTCESLSLISLVIADSWFAIIYLSKIIEAIWYSNLLIVDHYLIISAGLLWSILFLNPSHNNNYSSKLKNWVSFINKIPRITLLISILVVISGIFFVNSFYEKADFNSNSNDTHSNNDNNEIKIGVLLGLSGSSYESGITQEAVLNKALLDINENFSKSSIHKRVVPLQIEDTEIKPDVAVVKVKKLVDKGIRIIIGPQTSSELQKIKEYADQYKVKVLFISQSSTAPSLSKNDTIFRLLQNDNNQGKKIAEKMWSDGLKYVIPIWRDDQYGNELYNITKANFEKLGGKFSTENVTYDTHMGKFAGSLHRINFIVWDQILKNLGSQVRKATSEYGPNKVGVYIISYGELVPILIQAPSHEGLDNVNWYGSEATAKNERLLKHQKAAEFAYKTNFTSPLLSMNDTNGKFELLENAIKLKLNPNLKLNANDANVYDALWIAALTENISGKTTFEELKNNFNKIIDSYQGASGNIKLDSYGDRIGNYDLWMIKENVDTKHYEWEKITEIDSFGL
jgi:ABC-type branched-subunit amino acid transport system substrate-binding protein